MNNKEKSLREMCDGEAGFVTFVLVGNGPDVRIVNLFLRMELNGATFSTSSLNCYPSYFAFYILVLLVLPRQLKLTLNQCSSVSGFVCVRRVRH